MDNFDEDLNLKEPESPQLSSTYLSLLQSVKKKSQGSSITFSQNKTPWEARTIPTLVTDDSAQQLQTRTPKTISNISNSSRKSSYLKSLLASSSKVTRPQNIDLNSLRSSSKSNGGNLENISQPNLEPKSRLYTDGKSIADPAFNACTTKPHAAFPATKEEIRTNPPSTLACNSLKSSLSSANSVSASSNAIAQKEISPNLPPRNNVITINGKEYELMRMIGKGGSCNVYEAYDAQKQPVAIKYIKLSPEDKSATESFKNEITVLKRLQHSDRIITMFDYEYKKESNRLLVALEKGDTDFATFLQSRTTQNRITPEMIKFYWSEMLRAVEVIHRAGIIHSDLKPANFLIVQGHLKLIDFGISSIVPTDATSIIKDTKVGSIAYMSPEALISESSNNDETVIKISVSSDVWSLGCILYHMVYGKTPFHHIKDIMKIYLAIVNPNERINYPPLNDKLLLDVMQHCIVRQPKERTSIEHLLAHPYLTGKSEQNANSLLSELMVKLSPSSFNKVNKALQQLNLDKKDL